MPRKKKNRTYNDVARSIADMQQVLEDCKKNMVEEMVSAMDDRTAGLLGDLKPAELRRVAAMMYEHTEEYVEQAKAGKKPRKPRAKKEKTAMEEMPAGPAVAPVEDGPGSDAEEPAGKAPVAGGDLELYLRSGQGQQDEDDCPPPEAVFGKPKGR